MHTTVNTVTELALTLHIQCIYVVN